MINYRKLSSFKQYKWIISQFLGSEVQNQSHWAKVKGMAGIVSLGSSKGEAVCLSSSDSRLLHFWYVAPYSIFKAKSVTSATLSLSLTSVFVFMSPSVDPDPPTSLL